MNKILTPTIMALGIALNSPVFAQTAPDNTLDHVMKTHTLIMGIRSSSVPLSYYDDNHQPIGLAIDLCNKIADSVRAVVPDLQVKYREVSSSSRIPDLIQGNIDMECGSTTDNDNRWKQVDFTIPYYISGISGVVRASSSIHKSGDIPSGATIVYTKGTTTNDAIGTLDKNFYFKAKNHEFKEIQGSDHEQSFNMVTNGKADVFFNDDILLAGLIANTGHPNFYRMLTMDNGKEQVFSVEPYAVMIRKGSPRFLDLADKTIAGLMNSGQFEQMYNKWFMKPIAPNGATLNVPMSPLLRDIVRYPTPVIGAYTR